MNKNNVSIPAELIPEFEAWGKMTASLFGKLRQKAGIRPKGVPEDQAWFWTKEWQAMEREADDDMKSGNVERFSTVKDAISYLEKI